MKKVALVRGKFLNAYEMQSFIPLTNSYHLTAFSSLKPFHDSFPFPVVKLPSPMDLPEFPFKMQILNRMFIDAHYLVGLEQKLQGFDLVHSAETYYHYTQQSLHAKRLGYVKKVVATVLENIPFNNEGIWGRKRFKHIARTELDHIIALTEKTKYALLKEGTDPNKITVIGHGIDIGRFKPHSSHWQMIGRQKKDIHIFFVGRLEEYKGIFDVLKAFKILHRKYPEIVLSYIGMGGEEEKLKTLVKQKGLEKHVYFKKSTYDQIPLEYINADIFVAPSKRTKTWEEQYCTVLLEAQAMGLPIVATRSGGIPENVGDAALLVDEGNPEALAKAIEEFILSRVSRLMYGKKARERAEKVHDSRIIAQKIAGVYEKVLSS